MLNRECSKKAMPVSSPVCVQNCENSTTASGGSGRPANLLLKLPGRKAGRLAESDPETVGALIPAHFSDYVRLGIGLQQQFLRALNADAMQFAARRTADMFQ